jgi:hypothetical protein
MNREMSYLLSYVKQSVPFVSLKKTPQLFFICYSNNGKVLLGVPDFVWNISVKVYKASTVAPNFYPSNYELTKTQKNARMKCVLTIASYF